MASKLTQRIDLLAENKTGAAFKEVENSLKGLNSGAAAASKMLGPAIAAGVAVGIGALAKFTVETVQSADKLNKLSDRLGASTEALSQYEYVAKKSGVSFETLTMGWQRMTRRVAEAAQGMGEARGALKELGIDAVALNKLEPDKQFERLADAISKVGGQSDKVRLAMKLFDSEGVALVQTMTEGADGIRRVREEADRLGLTLDGLDADKSTAVVNSFLKWEAAVKGIKTDIGLTLLDVTKIATVMENASGWLKYFNDKKGDVKGALDGALASLKGGRGDGNIIPRKEPADVFAAAGLLGLPLPLDTGPIAAATIPKILSPAAESDLDRMTAFLADYRDFTAEDYIDVNGLMGDTFMPALDAGFNMATARANEIRKIQDESQAAYMAALAEQERETEERARRMNDAVEGSVRGFGYALTDIVSGATDAIEVMEQAAIRAAQNILDAWIQAGIDDIIKGWSAASAPVRGSGSVSGPSGSLGNPNTKAMPASAGGATVINFNVNAMDAASFLRYEPQVVGMIQKAYNKRGKTGPLG